MRINNGVLRIEGGKPITTGSISICYYCKNFRCEAYDTLELNITCYGAPARIWFRDLASVSQTLECPINKFEYNKKS